MAEMTLEQLARKLGGQLEGRAEAVIRGVAPLAAARRDEVSFLSNARYEKHVAGTGAAAIIVARDYEAPEGCKCGLIRCDDPYFAFRQAMVMLHGFRQVDFDGIDERAAVDPGAKLGDGVRIGAFAVVASGCEIGDGTVIYPGAYVGANCRIGRQCLIHPNVTLYGGTILGDRVSIHAGSSIGHDGFGYATHAGDDGVVRHEKIPQAGWVEIEDDVEIGACCAIDRATMGATIIGAGTKFSNLVAVGHGTQIGKHCLMVAQAGIAGSVMVGDYCVFAGQCGVVGHIRIGDGVRVGAKAGVVSDVAPGLEVLGIPATSGAGARRMLMSWTKVPQLRNAVRKLTREVQAIRRKLGMDPEGDSPAEQENT